MTSGRGRGLAYAELTDAYATAAKSTRPDSLRGAYAHLRHCGRKQFSHLWRHPSCCRRLWSRNLEKTLTRSLRTHTELDGTEFGLQGPETLRGAYGRLRHCGGKHVLASLGQLTRSLRTLTPLRWEACFGHPWGSLRGA